MLSGLAERTARCDVMDQNDKLRLSGFAVMIVLVSFGGLEWLILPTMFMAGVLLVMFPEKVDKWLEEQSMI